MKDPRLFKPFTIGERFLITPPGETQRHYASIQIVIGRGAFGSGEHETTMSCLQILEQYPIAQNAEVLDLGSGTGILALGALHLGAKEATCVDISPDAVKTSAKNCELNGFDTRTAHIAGSIDTLDDTPYDLILANIYGDLLLDLATKIVSRLKPGGHLLVSGMLWEYDFEVKKKYQSLGCSLIQKKMLEEFCTHLYKYEGKENGHEKTAKSE